MSTYVGAAIGGATAIVFAVGAGYYFRTRRRMIAEAVAEMVCLPGKKARLEGSMPQLMAEYQAAEARLERAKRAVEDCKLYTARSEDDLIVKRRERAEEYKECFKAYKALQEAQRAIEGCVKRFNEVKASIGSKLAGRFSSVDMEFCPMDLLSGMTIIPNLSGTTVINAGDQPPTGIDFDDDTRGWTLQTTTTAIEEGAAGEVVRGFARGPGGAGVRAPHFGAPSRRCRRLRLRRHRRKTNI